MAALFVNIMQVNMGRSFNPLQLYCIANIFATTSVVTSFLQKNHQYMTKTAKKPQWREENWSLNYTTRRNRYLIYLVQLNGLTEQCNLFCINKTVRNRPRSGRLQSLRERVKAVIVRSIKKNPKANAPQIRNALESRGVYVRTDTVKNALKRHGYNDRVARKNSTSMNGTVRSA